MPLFTWLCGLVTAVLGDAHSSAEAVTIFMGAASVGLVTWIGWRWLSPLAGIIAGLLLTFQTEAALYASSPLRESTYAALMLAGVALIGQKRTVIAAVFLALAFLCRFNIAFSLLPALILWGLWESRQGESGAQSSSVRGPLISAAIVLAVVIGWTIYYRIHSDDGQWQFWAGVMDKNAGNAVTDLFPMERFKAISLAFFGLFGWVLPSHFGWLASALALLAVLCFGMLRRREDKAGRWLLAATLSTLFLLAVTALVSAYPPDHNLYWKWLCPSVPYLALFAGHGAASVTEILRAHFPRNNAPMAAAALIFVASTTWDYFEQTSMQVELSEEYAGNQVRLARWVEDHWPQGSSVLCAHGEIAHLYLAGRASGPRALDWLQHAPRDSPEALGKWLGANQVALVLWFHEEWTGSQEVAGFLAEGRAMQLSEGVTVEPIGRLDRNDGAGFTAFQVHTKDPGFTAEQPAPTLRSVGTDSQ
jgi:4-amino-4-deoxy-L-arabinose transferase-like glycosyltransferase